MYDNLEKLMKVKHLVKDSEYGDCLEYPVLSIMWNQDEATFYGYIELNIAEELVQGSSIEEVLNKLNRRS